MSNSCKPNTRFVVDPAIVGAGSPSTVTANGDNTWTHDDGQGNLTVIGNPCEFADCATDPATGAAVIITLNADDTVTYANADGTPWPGNPGDLV